MKTVNVYIDLLLSLAEEVAEAGLIIKELGEAGCIVQPGTHSPGHSAWDSEPYCFRVEGDENTIRRVLTRAWPDYKDDSEWAMVDIKREDI